ncbi:MAG: S-methyl-5-thioribose-1-phosphate isomerase [Acidobacteria bacterium]|nr:S-methyl-5-thioribose-1-phosphate isomerase [Acidobacteriota bacterium]MCZ6727797.1 S-methyl-5-thioribose-1-phosphate isomerase [Acidobacteriota bacterium]
MDAFSPLRWRDDHLQLLDQTVLPHTETWLECRTPELVADAIRRLSVRGAPAIGVSAAFGLVVGMTGADDEDCAARFDDTWQLLAGTRPTAVNLRWALELGREVYERHRAEGAAAVRTALLAWAQELHAADIESNRRLGDYGAELFEAGNRVLTHCNAGALATGGYGTAIGVIQSSWAAGRLAMVWVDETRPLLQGARLTTWELERAAIPYRLVTDNSVGSLMSRGLVDRVVVGADRIAANGDTANKIGTYTIAVLADRHDVPFYVAAPLSTIDRQSATGAAIPIEERAGEEVTHVFGVDVAPEGAPAANFAFDVTPAELITAIITDVGVLKPPLAQSITQAFDTPSTSIPV